MRLILGAGYTGSRVARLALDRGEDVLCVVRSEARAQALAARGIPVTREPAADVARRLSSPDLHAIICFPPDGVTDAALAPLLASAGAISYVSTTGVYGDLSGTIDDATEVPPSPGNARLEAEACYRAVPGPGATILRAPGIYGPDRGLHVRIIQGLHRMPGDGSNMLSRIHVDDLAELLLASRGVHGETFVVGDLVPATQRDMATWICAEHGCPMPARVPAEEVHETLRRNRRIDGGRALRMLGVTLRYPSFRDGMKKGFTGPVR